MEYDHFLILPRTVEDGNNIIEKFYKQLYLISLLSNKHALIPPVQFRKVPLTELKDHNTLPLNFSEEEVTLLSMYCSDELNNNNNKYSNRDFLLPIPVVEASELLCYQDIAKIISVNYHWLLQLIGFFDFLTDGGYKVYNNIEPNDFLYLSDGSIKYFIGFDNLKYIKKANRDSLLEDNLYSLAYLLNKYYLKDTEIYDARLYQQNWFEKIEGRLIEPLLYNKYTAISYNSFSEIREDILGNIKGSLNKKRIGVFLDVANILTPMYTELSRMTIDFDKLLRSVYGRGINNIVQKVAVIFLPEYEGEGFKEDKYNLIFDIKEYLESCDFEIFTVENETAAAKVDINGELKDTDDSKLIEFMEEAINDLDSALLLTGDKHFVDIARRYRVFGKEIKLISVSEDNTSNVIINEFDHQYIYEYWDCIDFV